LKIIFDKDCTKLHWLHQFSAKLGFTNASTIDLDLSREMFCSPFSVAFSLSCLRAFKERNPHADLNIIPPKSLLSGSPYQWMERIGFISCANKIFNKPFNKTSDKGSNNYIPADILILSEFISYDRLSRSDMNESILDKSGRLTTVLTHLSDGAAYNTIKYTIREIIRNVYEHSGSHEILICAQYWRNKNIVQMTICDFGMGIKNSLSANEQYADLDGYSSIKIACLPGVSGNYKDLQNKDPLKKWQNTGYGLYMASSICRNDGDFYIISNENAILFKGKERRRYEIKGFKGTLIRMTLCLDDVENFPIKFEGYLKRGEELSRMAGEGRFKDASFASRMLDL